MPKVIIILLLVLVCNLGRAEEKEDMFTTNSDDSYYTSLELTEQTGDVSFRIKEKEVLRITKNGQFFANGKLMIEKDKRIYENFKRWLDVPKLLK